MKKNNKKIRKWASTQQCQIRLPGCQGTPCIGAHYRMPGLCGMGMKPHDLFIAVSCQHCHDIVDGRKDGHHNDGKLISRKEADRAHLTGVLRTQALMIEENLMDLEV